MNSGSLGKIRTLVVKNRAFLVVFALVTLAYVATPLTTFACQGQNNSKKPIRQQNSSSSSSSSSSNQKPSTNADNQIIAALKAGTRLQFIVQGKPVQFNTLKPNEPFQIKVRGKTLQAVYLGNNKAIVTLPSGKKVTFQDVNGKITVTPLNADRQTLLLLKTSRSLQFFDLQGNPLDPSSIQIGDLFQIEIAGKFLRAQYLGKGNVRVTLPSGQKTILSLGQFLTV